MGIFLILAQVTLASIVYGAHALALSPWLTFLPAILFGVIWALAVLCGGAFWMDRVNPIGRRM